jgi:hypothetical protein
MAIMAFGKTIGSNEQAQWLSQWKSAAVLLGEQRAKELQGMTAPEAWAAIDSVLSLPLSNPLSKERLTNSGLVVLQEYLKQLSQ